MELIPIIVGGLGPMEFGIIFAMLILLFGASKLPELARSSGEAMGEFKKGRQEMEEELEQMQGDTDDSEDTKETEEAATVVE